MKAQIRLILSTLALTVLIWAYADRAGHGIIELSVPVTLKPIDPSNRLVLTVVDAPSDKPDVAPIKMTFRGPKRAIGLLRSYHDHSGLALTVPITEAMTPGPQRLSLLALLSDAPEILQRGLTIDTITPEAVDVVVDRFKMVRVSLEADAGGYADDLAAAPVITPPEVSARVREGKLGEGFALPPLILPLEQPITEAIRNRPAGTGGPLVFEDVPLRSSWPGIEATFEPAQVQVTVRLERESQVERITVRPLGVNIKSPDFFDGYQIIWEDETDAKLTQLTQVRVPLAKLDRLLELEANTEAYIILDDTDLPREPAGLATTQSAGSEQAGTFRRKPVHFHFPPGFEDVKLEGPPATVGLRVEPKVSPAQPATP